ncbi:unnamed protein product [Spirodela intermedia]|uniref:Rx N-terminal domain-containing protein n=1 Tax=Spirodela intermedia TaxID=51605 RepID=A0ABN7ED26_SPIIN|nr:unnamed protein product [Spirodela intermedia]
MAVAHLSIGIVISGAVAQKAIKSFKMFEFDVIQAFLSYIDVWKDSNEALEAWIKHIREIVFKVEDIIDACKVGHFFCSTVFHSWRDIANKLEDVVKRLDHIGEIKEQYGIKTRERGDASSVAIERRQKSSEDAHSIRSSEIVGFDQYRETLERWLTDEIARTDDILKRIIKELRKGEEVQELKDINKMTHLQLIKVLKYDLKHNRYIVSDIIEPPLDHPNCQGRIILTTRNEDGASLADENRTLELKPIPENELVDISKQMVEKCECLPLGIVAIEKVVNGLDWEFNTNPDLHQWKSDLALSYKDLSDYLKNCFLYFCMFPKDLVMKRNRLIRLLIAEGFIEERGRSYARTPDEVAEENLNELVNKCMLQVSVHQCGQKNETKNVIIHPIRSLLLFHSVNLPFQSFRLLKVLDLQNSGFPNERLPEASWDLCNLRHLILRNTKVCTNPKRLEHFVYLQKLDLAYTRVKKLPTSITKLKYLRNLFRTSCSKGMWNMENLQILQSVEATNEITNHLEDMVQLRSFRITDVKPDHPQKLCAGIRKMENFQKLDIMTSTENKTDELDLNELSPPQSLKKLPLRGRLKGGALPKCSSSHQNLAYLHLACVLPRLVSLVLLKAYLPSKLFFFKGFPMLRELRIVDMMDLQYVEFSANAMPSLCQLNLVRCEKSRSCRRHLQSNQSRNSLLGGNARKPRADAQG